MTAQDNAATVRALNEAYNKRDWDGAIALTAPEVIFVNIAGGKLVELWQNWDQLGLLQQIGAIPAPR